MIPNANQHPLAAALALARVRQMLRLGLPADGEAPNRVRGGTGSHAGYQTYRDQVHLGDNQALGFRPGFGFYARNLQHGLDTSSLDQALAENTPYPLPHTPGAGGGYIAPPSYAPSPIPMAHPPLATYDPNMALTPVRHLPMQPAPGYSHPPMAAPATPAFEGTAALHALSQASPRNQLENLATARAVAQTLQHLRLLRPSNPGMMNQSPPGYPQIPNGLPQTPHYL